MPERKDGRPRLLGAQKLTIEERLWGRMIRQPGPDGCWVFDGTIISTGYGGIHYNGKFRRAHQVAWLLSGKGDLPKWPMVIDHRCGELRCINPDHLRIVPHADNCTILAHKRDSPFLINRTKTHCIKGHEFTPENTALYRPPSWPKGTRVCLTCRPHYWRWAIVPREPPPNAKPWREPKVKARPPVGRSEA